MASQSYIGKGNVYLGKVGEPLLNIGNTSKLDFSFEEEKKELMDYQNAGGGVADSLSRIKAVNVSLTVHQLSPENLALALRGETANSSAGAVTDEEHVAKTGGLIVFNKTPSQSVAYVVENLSGTITYVEGTDYRKTPAGLIVLEGSTIVDGSTISVNYTALAAIEIEALTAVGEELNLVYDGINEVTGKPIVVEIYRLKPGLAKGWNLIGDDFASLEIEASVLKDDTVTGAGLSQYFSARMAS
ncbi:MAG: hypothetical protein BWY57_01609 [Betaproteobacteria bacterium ADurb.Bin341]|nr:MAG: hypothetical protein BWY57_01609 [Betaproteobacteria bacterium ADurb.Bin341]